MKLISYININIMSDLDKSTPMSSNTEEKILFKNNALDDDASEADASEADASEADASEVDASEADAIEGDAIEGDAIEGDAIEEDESDDEANASEMDAADVSEEEVDADEESEADVDEVDMDDDDEDDDDIDTDAGDDDIEDDENMNNSKSTKGKRTKKKIITTEVETVLGTSLSGPDNIETAAEDYDSDDDEYEAEDFQKLDDEMRKNYVLMNHPESINQNYEEIYKMSKTVRNKNNVIVDAAHRTIPMLTKYEKARILGVRAKQINNGSAPFIDLKENIIDGYLIAERELAEKKLPFIIRRPLPNRGSEYWRLEDLEIL